MTLPLEYCILELRALMVPSFQSAPPMSTPATQETGVGGIEEHNQPGETVMTSLLQGVKSS